MRTIVLLAILFSCNSKKESPPTPPPTFSKSEVVGALNALTAIIEFPQETKQLQTNLNVNVENAQKLISPLHPLWDEKLTEASLEMVNWNKDQIKQVIDNCSQNCECDFYQLALEKHADVLDGASEELKIFAGLKFSKTKDQALKCIDKLPPLGNLLKYLHDEVKNYQAESVI